MAALVPPKFTTKEHKAILFAAKTLLFKQPLGIVCLVNAQTHSVDVFPHTRTKSGPWEKLPYSPQPNKHLILSTEPVSMHCLWRGVFLAT